AGHSFIQGLSGKQKREPEAGSLWNALFRVLDRSRLPDDRHPDLTREAELGLDSLGDVAGHQLGRRVVDLLRLDEDSHLAAGLDRVRLLDSGEGVCYLLQLLQPLDVSLERLAARPGAGGRDGV